LIYILKIIKIIKIMKTITLKYMDGLSVECKIDNTIITIIDIIKHIHKDNKYIYSLYKIGEENRLALATTIKSLLAKNTKELFILQENIYHRNY